MDYHAFRYVPLWLSAGFLMVAYTIMALKAARLKGRQGASLCWALALIATVIGAGALDSAEKASIKALVNSSPPWPRLSLWFLALAGVMALVPAVRLAHAFAIDDLNEKILWGTMLTAALTVLAETGLYHFYQGWWTVGSTIAQLAFGSTGFCLAVFTIVDVVAWLRTRSRRRSLRIVS